MRRFPIIFLSGIFCLIGSCNTCEASARQDELERYLAPQRFSIDLTAASLDLIYMQDQGVRANKFYGTRTDRNLEGYDTRLNLTTDGFIYHPYFFDFNASGALGYLSEDGALEIHEQPELNQELSTKLNIREYNFQVTLLKPKPYSMTLFANRSISHFDSDFFTRLTTDGENYGINGRYWNKVWPLTWSLAKSTSDTWGQSASYHNEDVTFSLMSFNKREQGESRLTYRYQDFLREINDALVNDGVQQHAMFSDRRLFGASGAGSLFSLARFITQDGFLNRFKSLSLDEEMFIGFARVWNAASSYAYSSYEMDESVSQNHLVNASLSHKLFESLGSSVFADGAILDSEGSRTTRLGAGISESYTKKIGASSRLDLAYSHRENWEDRSSSGSTTGTLRESVALRNGSTFLGAIGIDLSSITVRDDSETITFQEGFDYEVFHVGARTQIRRLVGGRISDGATVVVIYRASSGGNENFGTANDNASFRLHLLNNHLEMYGQMNNYRVRDAMAPLVLQGMEKNIGASCFWGILSGGIDYMDSSLTLSQYKKLTSYEAIQVSPFSSAHLGLNFQQSRTDYSETGNSLQTLAETLTFDMTMWRDSAFHLLAGHYDEKALSEENRYLTISASLSVFIGQLQVSLGHDYRDHLRNKDVDTTYHTYLKLRRAF